MGDGREDEGGAAKGGFRPATRQHALARLEAFLPRAGAAYARGRNTVAGPSRPEAVSRLSPFLQRRLLGEAEVVRRVVGRHRPFAAEKFLQEVLWRTYWKGWLMQRPWVWRAYLAARQASRDGDGDAVARAEAGQLGPDAMNLWARELVETGYLHNHVRMWFASIWIFTLKLPWAAGADFFHRHLLDGDPASNTLSWRWVAGLQTRGKHYLARVDNIVRSSPLTARQVGLLAEGVPPLPDDDHTLAPPDPTKLPAAASPPAGRAGLLLTAEDLSPEAADLAGWTFVAIAALGVAAVASDLRLAAPAVAFGEEAIDDGLRRCQAHFRAPVSTLSVSEVLAWARAAGLDALVVPLPQVGPWQDALAGPLEAWRSAGLEVLCPARAHDVSLFPRAARGYFHFKRHVLPR